MSGDKAGYRYGISERTIWRCGERAQRFADGAQHTGASHQTMDFSLIRLRRQRTVELAGGEVFLLFGIVIAMERSDQQ